MGFRGFGLRVQVGFKGSGVWGSGVSGLVLVEFRGDFAIKASALGV